jgi:hypothetical protein
MQFLKERIRILFDVERTTTQEDDITGGSPEMWRNNDVQFEFAFQFDGEFVDASVYTQIKLLVKDNLNRRGPTLMSKTVGVESITPVLSAEEWTAKTKQHCVINFTAAETRLDLQGKPSRQFFLSVIALTNTGARLTLGSAILTLNDDGESDDGVSPAIGSSIIPQGATYDGAGNYVLSTLTPNVAYRWDKNANDTKLVNGTEQVLASGNFFTQTNQVTLVGTPNALITATLRNSVTLTLEELDARFQKKAPAFSRSPNGNFIVVWGVNDNGEPYGPQVIDLRTQSAP